MSAGVLKILVNSNAKMSRGKYAAQAVHAALSAAGVHPGCPVIVLGATPAEIEKCSVKVYDAGVTELAPGTLTAGVAERPDAEWSLQIWRTITVEHEEGQDGEKDQGQEAATEPGQR